MLVAVAAGFFVGALMVFPVSPLEPQVMPPAAEAEQVFGMPFAGS